MGYREMDFALPSDYSEETLRQRIIRKSGDSAAQWRIVRKSLDARKKKNVVWRVQVLVESEHFADPAPEAPRLEIPRRLRDKRVVVAGSGPAGFFAARVLRQAGFPVTLIERGRDVDSREDAIRTFEAGGAFSEKGNYAFGEGGAGTFSDGKLTSRSKRISLEREYIIESYIAAGAPEEIRYLTHPHLGTDNLRAIVRRLRLEFEAVGGEYHFETQLTGIRHNAGQITAAKTSTGLIDCDYLIIAPGHSAYDTYRMLINAGIPFRAKNFALGCRVEHPQELINTAQWGRPSLPGVKAAEYRLTAKGPGGRGVYTFCMCPGGIVVPSAAFEQQNIVNGMSEYARAGAWANAACVAAVDPYELPGTDGDPAAVLNWLENLEGQFYRLDNSYAAPAAAIADFMETRLHRPLPASSYPLGLMRYPLWSLLPETVTQTLQAGLTAFGRKLRGFENGVIMGLESKTSAPIQVLREADGSVTGFENLSIIGEGGGYAGGIISSAADGIRAAMAIAQTAG